MHNARFLIAEDSSLVRLVLNRIIRNRLGATDIYLASDGTAALEILNEQQIDFIIADWSMPTLGGKEFIKEVHKDPKKRAIPFIMLTTKHDRVSTDRVLELGATQHIVKPFEPDELEEKVRSAWNVTNKRKERRHAFLPTHDAVLTADDKQIPADIINISRSGLLLRLHHSPEINIFKSYKIKLTVEMPDTQEYVVIEPLVGKAIRLDSEECNRTASGEDCYIHRSLGGCPSINSNLCSMAFCLLLDEMDDYEKKALDKLIDWLASRCPNIVKDE